MRAGTPSNDLSTMSNLDLRISGRVCVALAGSQADAEKSLRSRVEKDFYPAIKSSPIADDSSDEVMRLLQWIPDAVKETLKQVPLGMGEYYAELFYDLG